jgi:PAS domain S-box-containing protein
MNEPITDSFHLTPLFMTALIESANDAIISKNLNGIITSWNKGAERIFGYRADEIVGKSVMILIPPDRHDEELQILSSIRAGKRVDHFETMRCRKDGRLVEISLTVSPIKDADGTIVGASKIVREMTELREAQRQLQTSEERYRTLFDSIDEGFCVIEMLYDEFGKATDYRFLEVNPAFERHTGLVNAKGKTMRGMVPDHEDNWFEIYAEVDRNGEPLRFENWAKELGRWFDLYALRVGDPQEHKIAVLFVDITVRKKAEEEGRQLLSQLAAERAKLEYIFGKAPAFVATHLSPTDRPP